MLRNMPAYTSECRHILPMCKMLYVHTGSQTFNEQCTCDWFPFSEGAWSCSRINTAAGFQHRAVCFGLPLPQCLLKHFPFTLLLFALSWSSKPQRMEANEIPQPLPHPSPPHSRWEWKRLRAIGLTLGTSRNINGVATTSSWSCHLHPTVLRFFSP